MTVYRHRNILKHPILVSDISPEEYEKLVDWIRENIPTTERKTPAYRDEGTMYFGFVTEEYAMAFKLILPIGAIR